MDSSFSVRTVDRVGVRIRDRVRVRDGIPMGVRNGVRGELAMGSVRIMNCLRMGRKTDIQPS